MTLGIAVGCRATASSCAKSQTEESRTQRQLAGLVEADEGLDEGRSPEEQDPVSVAPRLDGAVANHQIVLVEHGQLPGS